MSTKSRRAKKARRVSSSLDKRWAYEQMAHVFYRTGLIDRARLAHIYTEPDSLWVRMGGEVR